MLGQITHGVKHSFSISTLLKATVVDGYKKATKGPKASMHHLKEG